MSLKSPSIELIQAGLCITLYEYAHCITERAYITIGTSARMASLLKIHYNTDGGPQFASTEDNFDESAHVVIAMHLLNWHIYLSLRMLGKHLNSEYSPIIVASEPPETPVMGRVLHSFRYEAQGCRILSRLHQTFYAKIGDSRPTQLDQVIALDNELRNMELGFRDYDDSPTWRGELAAYAVASFFVFNFYNQQEEIAAATECLGQRHIEVLASIEMLVRMVEQQLSEAAASGHNADCLTPLSMTILALGADGLKSLRSVEMGEGYIASQTRVFTDLLRCLGARWNLGKEYLKTRV